MENIKITVNGVTKNYPKLVALQVVASVTKPIENIVAAKINNELYPLDKRIGEDCEVTFINYNDLNGYNIYKSGLKLIFEVALKEVFPGLEISYEHSVPRGMLGIIEGSKVLNNEDVSLIKSKMAEIIASDEIIEKITMDPKKAIKHYKEAKEFEKSDNVQNINDKEVTMYKLRNRFNYFYSLMPFSTGVINKYDLVYLGKNRVIFLFPSKRSKGDVPEYVHYDSILESFYGGKSWLDKLNMPYITNLNENIGNGKIKDFIRSCELMFNLDIARVAKDVSDNKQIKFVLIAGPSSSGKTTTTTKLSSCLSAFGYDPIKISIDDYFVNREDTPKDEEGKYDFECLDAIDLELFNQDLAKLLNNEEVILPNYNFITGKREISDRRIKLNENSIILIEGLHALNDKLTEAIDINHKYKVYLSPFIPLNIDRHNYISTIDLRLIRRIIRDNRTRGYSVTMTIDNWQVVRNGEEKYIFPYIHEADIIVNTALAYEVGVLKVFVEPLLYSVGPDSKYYEEARRLIDFLKQFFPIPGEYVNDDSILREFIGGKYND